MIGGRRWGVRVCLRAMCRDCVRRRHATAESAVTASAGEPCSGSSTDWRPQSPAGRSSTCAPASIRSRCGRGWRRRHRRWKHRRRGCGDRRPRSGPCERRRTVDRAAVRARRRSPRRRPVNRRFHRRIGGGRRRGRRICPCPRRCGVRPVSHRRTALRSGCGHVHPRMAQRDAASAALPIGTAGPNLLAADDREHLVAPLLHDLRRDAFEIQAQQRLGVGGPDVEVPVGELRRDAVELVDVAVAVGLAPAPRASPRTTFMLVTLVLISPEMK